MLHRIHRGDLPATTDGHSYRVAATDLDQRTDLVPAAPNDPHPRPRPHRPFGVRAHLSPSDRARAASGPTAHDTRRALRTAREIAVLRAVAHGRSNAEISTEQLISYATAKTHVSRLLTKLQGRDRAQLVMLAYENGVVSPGNA